MKAEKAIRDVIAEITKKLNGFNLSANDGIEHADNLSNAYKALRNLDLYKHVKELAKEGVANSSASGTSAPPK